MFLVPSLLLHYIISDIYEFRLLFCVHINNLGNLLLETNAIIIPFFVGEIKEHILLAHIVDMPIYFVGQLSQHITGIE